MLGICLLNFLSQLKNYNKFKFEIIYQDLLSYLRSTHWFVEPREGVDEEVWAPCELGWLGIGEGAELGTCKVRVSLPEGEGGGGEG